MRRARVVCLLVVVSLLAAPFARAQTPPPPANPVFEQAKQHFQKGVTLYNDANYGGALAEFEAAYRIHPVSAVLYNIALTQKALFNYSEAIATFERYLSEAKSTSAERRNEVDQLIAEMKSLMAEVTLRVVPDGASVIVDGRTVGTAPLAPLGLASGHHVVEVNAEGHRPQRRELTVAAGMPLVVSIELEPLPRTGRVEITSVPGARVSLDGHSAGHAPLGMELTEGGHSIEVTLDGYKSYRGELLVTSGQRRSLVVVLERVPQPPPFHRRWWFWTAGAVAITGVVVGLAVGLSLQPINLVDGTMGTRKID